MSGIAHKLYKIIVTQTGAQTMGKVRSCIKSSPVNVWGIKVANDYNIRSCGRALCIDMVKNNLMIRVT